MHGHVRGDARDDRRQRPCVLADEPVDARDRRLPLCGQRQATEQQHARSEHEHGRHDHAEPDFHAGDAAGRHQ